MTFLLHEMKINMGMLTAIPISYNRMTSNSQFFVAGLGMFFIIFNLILCDKCVNHKYMCPICKKKLIEHSKLQDKICKMIAIKQFANNSPGFDVQLDLSSKINHFFNRSYLVSQLPL